LARLLLFFIGVNKLIDKQLCHGGGVERPLHVIHFIGVRFRGGLQLLGLGLGGQELTNAQFAVQFFQDSLYIGRYR